MISHRGEENKEIEILSLKLYVCSVAKVWSE